MQENILFDISPLIISTEQKTNAISNRLLLDIAFAFCV